MANTFRCIATSPTATVDGTLSFRGAGAQKQVHIESIDCAQINVLLSVILGTAPQGSQIRFNLVNERTLVLRFPSQDIWRAAHRAFRQFEREEFGLTPPDFLRKQQWQRQLTIGKFRILGYKRRLQKQMKQNEIS